MGGVKVGERHQDHEEDGQYREHEHAQRGQRQQRLVELAVRQGLYIVLGALELLAGGQDLLGDLVLADVGSPGVQKRQHEEQRQHAVEQDEEGVVAVDGLATLLVGLNDAQGVQLAQVRRAEVHHVQVEHRLEQEEQYAPAPLAAGEGTGAHHQVGQPGLPVAVPEGGEQIRDGEPQPLEQTHDPQAQPLEQAADPARQAREEPAAVMGELLGLAHFQVIQINHTRVSSSNQSIWSKKMNRGPDTRST